MCSYNYKYEFKFKPQIYEYIKKDRILDEYKNEPKILDMIIKGYPCNKIGDKLGYSTRTVQRRKREIYEKTKDLMF